MKQEDPQSYLSKQGDLYQVIHRSLPVTSLVDKEAAMTAAKRFGIQTDVIWNGDKGCFESFDA